MSRRTVPEEVSMADDDSASTSPAADLALHSPYWFPVKALVQANDKLRVLRHYMLLSWLVRSLGTVFVVCFLSLLHGAEEIKHVDALTSKDSILNQVFVKMGWAWTLLAVIVFVSSLLPLSAEPLKVVGKTTLRLLLLSAVFYFWCALVFPMVEQRTGICLSKNVVVSRHDKRKCLKGGNTFYSFDVSGHAFLMVYCSLTLVQEAKALRRYLNMGKVIASLDTSGNCKYDDGPVVNEAKSMDIANNELSKEDVMSLIDIETDNRVSTTEAVKFRSVYMSIWPIIIFSYLCLCMLCFTWDVVLVITTIYYHTLLEKFLGVIIGVGSWALLYETLFSKYNLT